MRLLCVLGFILLSSVSDEPQKPDSAYAAAPTLAAAVRTSDVTGGYRHKARQFSKWINSSSSAQLDIRTFTTHTHTSVCACVCAKWSASDPSSSLAHVMHAISESPLAEPIFVAEQRG